MKKKIIFRLLFICLNMLLAACVGLPPSKTVNQIQPALDKAIYPIDRESSKIHQEPRGSIPHLATSEPKPDGRTCPQIDAEYMKSGFWTFKIPVTLNTPTNGIQCMDLVHEPPKKICGECDKDKMGLANFLWLLLAGTITALWLLATYIRDRALQSIEQNRMMTAGLLVRDKLTIENPDIQKFISLNAAKQPEDFDDKELLNHAIFIKAKSLIYIELNLFDEILSDSSKTGKEWWNLLKPAKLNEIRDWELYITKKLRHPLYQSIMEKEGKVFGDSLQKFWGKIRQTINDEPADPLMW